MRGFADGVFRVLGEKFLDEWIPVEDTPEEVITFNKVNTAEEVVVGEVEDVKPEPEYEVTKKTVKEVLFGIEDASREELEDYLMDDRITVKKAAEAEIQKRKVEGV